MNLSRDIVKKKVQLNNITTKIQNNFNFFCFFFKDFIKGKEDYIPPAKVDE